MAIQPIWDENNTLCETWFERDRAHVRLETLDGEIIVEFWDDEVEEMVDMGFLRPQNWHGSAIEYANDIGIMV